MELKNRTQRMEFLQNEQNWKTKSDDGLIKVFTLDYGEHQFIRIEGYMMDRFYREPKDSWIGQFEVLFDGNNDYLVSRSNSEICDIMAKEKSHAKVKD